MSCGNTSDSACSIAAHPFDKLRTGSCKKRKDGALSFEMEYTEIKGGSISPLMIAGANELTAFLAVWGAILSSITFGWTLYRDLRDRAKIKLTAEVRRIGRR